LAVAVNEDNMKQDQLYLVSYVHIQIENQDSYTDFSLYFAGLVDSKEEAEVLARACSLNLKNGTIIPKILSFDSDMSLIDMMYDASEKFQKILLQMREMHDRFSNFKKKKK
jgi:hypothetical protein